MTASGSRIAEIAGRHTPIHAQGYENVYVCSRDKELWPCDAYTFGQMLTPERLAAALVPWTDRHVIVLQVEEIPFVLAALEATP